MKRLISVAIIGVSLVFMVLAACGGEASVADAAGHNYCLPFPFLNGHAIF